ncbi:TPA: hypothetical protein ACGO8M_002104 [Streptococcus suis]|nr:hypothetical protein [Streptococcus suis]
MKKIVVNKLRQFLDQYGLVSDEVIRDFQNSKISFSSNAKENQISNNIWENLILAFRIEYRITPMYVVRRADDAIAVIIAENFGEVDNEKGEYWALILNSSLKYKRIKRVIVKSSETGQLTFTDYELSLKEIKHSLGANSIKNDKVADALSYDEFNIYYRQKFLKQINYLREELRLSLLKKVHYPYYLKIYSNV